MSHASTESAVSPLADPALRPARAVVYAAFTEKARAPTVEEFAAALGVCADEASRMLHEAHVFFLEEGGHIRMTRPFSTVNTGSRRTRQPSDVACQLCVGCPRHPRALRADADIEERCAQSGEVTRLVTTAKCGCGSSSRIA